AAGARGNHPDQRARHGPGGPSHVDEVCRPLPRARCEDPRIARDPFRGVMAMELRKPELYINRELSWLEFNRRVLELAKRSEVPALERLKFVAIAASNLDEFYMVRVGSLERQLRRGTPSVDPQGDDYRPRELLREIGKRARQLNLEISLAFTDYVAPHLHKPA